MKIQSAKSPCGIRPALAFVFIAAVLILVVGKAWVLVTADPGAAHVNSAREITESLPAPNFDIVDREGRMLALSVQRMDLALSPRAMWQAHTPRRMAELIAPLIASDREGVLTADDLMERFLPSRDPAGWISISENGWRLDFEMASRVRAWITKMGLEDGFELLRQEDRPIWDLWWQPAVVLSEGARNPHGKGNPPKLGAWRWARIIADGLGRSLWPDLDVYQRSNNWKQRDAQRARIWRALMPSAEAVVFRGIPAGAVQDLIALLDEEGVRSHQMRVDFEHERVYPARDGREEAAFALLGRWRFLSESQASSRAQEAFPGSDEASLARRELRRRELLDRKFHRDGLEGVAGELLNQDIWSYIAPQSASYVFLRNRSALEGSRRYFREESCEGRTPVVHATLDTNLQRFLHERLERAIEDNQAALAMGIVIDVQSGAVLAVDGFSEPGMWEFLPTWHKFTPGSTFKVIVMATAIDAGKVTPTDRFDTHDGHYRLPNSRRVIREARNAPTGTITASQALSHSVNAVMVQIGALLDDDHFASKLVHLGYSTKPGSGLGTESSGSIPALPWRLSQSQASVSFGHELLVSLWQHAAGLATVVRGGEFLPLHMVTGVEWNGAFRKCQSAEPSRVFSAAACAEVRAMMAQGASIGTGRHITAAEDKLGTRIELLSKTGTTEKTVSEPCLHLELARNHGNLGVDRDAPAYITFKQMMTRQRESGRPHKRTCYTSSICLVGRVSGTNREIMTLIVIEEPRGKNKYGSDVAGPTAIAVLKEALGLSRGGVPAHILANQQTDYGYEREGLAVAMEQPWSVTTEQDY